MSTTGLFLIIIFMVIINLELISSVYYLPIWEDEGKRHLGTQPHIFGIVLSIDESSILSTSRELNLSMLGIKYL